MTVKISIYDHVFKAIEPEIVEYSSVAEWILDNKKRLVNFTVALAGTPDNLDQKFTVNIDTTDPDNLLRKELDRIPLDTTEKILLTYRAYLSDDLTEPQSLIL